MTFPDANHIHGPLIRILSIREKPSGIKTRIVKIDFRNGDVVERIVQTIAI